MEEKNKNILVEAYNNSTSPEGTATHSGWQQFYNTFSKHRDECIQLGKNVLGNNLQLAIMSLSDYHSALYSLAQQIMPYYDKDTETELTDEWLEINEEVNDFLSRYVDSDFRKQMTFDGVVTLDLKIKKRLLNYFNVINRLAMEAGLLVGKLSNASKESKRGLLGFK
jgi:hypothetical protein